MPNIGHRLKTGNSTIGVRAPVDDALVDETLSRGCQSCYTVKLAFVSDPCREYELLLRIRDLADCRGIMEC